VLRERKVEPKRKRGQGTRREGAEKFWQCILILQKNKELSRAMEEKNMEVNFEKVL